MIVEFIRIVLLARNWDNLFSNDVNFKGRKVITKYQIGNMHN